MFRCLQNGAFIHQRTAGVIRLRTIIGRELTQYHATSSTIYRLQSTIFRPFSSQRVPKEATHSPSLDNDKNKKTPTSKAVVFYRRDIPRENRGLRAITAFSFVNTTYWCWYAERCISSEFLGVTAPFYVNPEMGLIGVVTALLINAVSYTFATSILISKLSFHSSRSKVRVRLHQFPFWTPDTNYVDYEWGDIYLDRRSKEVQHLLGKLGGDATKFVGYLPLRVVQDEQQKSRWPMVLHLKEPLTVKNKDMFIEALLVDHTPGPDDVYEEEEGELGSNRKRARQRRRSIRRRTGQ